MDPISITSNANLSNQFKESKLSQMVKDQQAPTIKSNRKMGKANFTAKIPIQESSTNLVA